MCMANGLLPKRGQICISPQFLSPVPPNGETFQKHSHTSYTHQVIRTSSYMLVHSFPRTYLLVLHISICQRPVLRIPCTMSSLAPYRMRCDGRTRCGMVCLLRFVHEKNPGLMLCILRGYVCTYLMCLMCACRARSNWIYIHHSFKAVSYHGCGGSHSAHKYHAPLNAKYKATISNSYPPPKPPTNHKPHPKTPPAPPTPPHPPHQTCPPPRYPHQSPPPPSPRRPSPAPPPRSGSPRRTQCVPGTRARPAPAASCPSTPPPRRRRARRQSFGRRPVGTGRLGISRGQVGGVGRSGTYLPHEWA